MNQTVSRKCIPACVLALATFGPLHAEAWTFKTLYTFQGGNDGSQPLAAVTATGGKLYGTTLQGGGSGCGNTGCGVVFAMTTTGTESVIFSFNGGSQGNSPRAPLLNVGGTLYSTAEFGGNASGGVIFSITPAGTENTLYTFQGGSNDGDEPFGGLTNVNGTLYGTTAGGGASGHGTVFSVTTAGQEKIIYSFKSGSDGASPESGLIDVNGTLYGTTFSGGTQGDGTVFKVTTSGSESVLWSFKGGADGESPFAALTNVNGTLFGTTRSGGGTGCGGRGCGTVFKVTSAGVESIVYNFQGGNDGGNPETNLLNKKGNLFGTTRIGGSTTACGNEGCGTVFEMTQVGAVTYLHKFSGASDGSFPQAGLINVSGTLYGTTNGGNGTVFSLVK